MGSHECACILLVVLASAGCGGSGSVSDAGQGSIDAGPTDAVIVDPDLGACTGAGPAVPSGYPQLGPGCATHIVYSLGDSNDSSPEEAVRVLDLPPTDEGASARGARPIPDAAGAYDLGLQSSDDPFFFPVALYLASLEPGIHRDDERFAIRSQLGSFFPLESTDRDGRFSATNYGTGTIEIAGRTDAAVWGRFIGRVCSFTYECRYTLGTFAAALETTPSDLGYGTVPIDPPPDRVEVEYCFDDHPDCPAPTSCATFPCSRHRCQFTPDNTVCGADEYCSLEQGGCYRP